MLLRGYERRNTMTIGEKLKKARKERDITQTELAKVLGTVQSIITDIERGRRTPSKAIAMKLAEYFNTNAEYWLDEKAEMQYIQSRPNLEMTLKAIEVLRDKHYIVDGVPNDKAWDILKEALTIDLKFLEAKK